MFSKKIPLITLWCTLFCTQYNHSQTSQHTKHTIYDFSNPPFLYKNRSISTVLRTVLKSPSASRIAGWVANTHIPFITNILIKRMVQSYDINLEEAEYQKTSDYGTINALFTRKLLPKSRPIDGTSNTSCISPSDGLLTYFKIPDVTTPFIIKETIFDLLSFTGNKKIPDKMNNFADGTFIIIYLSPRDYHRFHMPCNGVIESVQVIEGTYESVNPQIPTFSKSLQENKRTLITIKPDCNPEKQIILSAVGAMFVGEIIINSNIKPGSKVKIGEEIGYFSFGGSTITLLLPKNFFRPEVHYLPFSPKNSLFEWTPVQMGKKIGILEDMQK